MSTSKQTLIRVGRVFCVVAGVAATAAAVGGALWLRPWIEDVLRGPHRVTSADLVDVADVNDLSARHVTVKPGKVLDLPDDGGKGRYVLLKVKDRWLLTNVPAGELKKELTGYLVARTDGPMADAVAAAAEHHPTATLLPFQLETRRNPRDEGLAACAGLTILALFGLFSLATGVFAIGIKDPSAPAKPVRDTARLRWTDEPAHA